MRGDNSSTISTESGEFIEEKSITKMVFEVCDKLT